MRINRANIFVAVLFVLPALLGPVAAQDEVVPERPTVCVSFSSFSHFLDALDGYMARVCADMALATPPGMLQQQVARNVPLMGTGAWDEDSEFHIVAVYNLDTRSLRREHAFVVTTGSFSDLLGELMKYAYDASQIGDTIRAEVVGMGTYYFAELPGGRAAFMTRSDMLPLLASLCEEGKSRASVLENAGRAEILLPDGWLEQVPGPDLWEGLVSGILTAGSSPLLEWESPLSRFIRAAAGSLLRAGPFVKAETRGVRAIELEMIIDDDCADLTLKVKSAPGTWLSGTFERIGGRPRIDAPAVLFAEAGTNRLWMQTSLKNLLSEAARVVPEEAAGIVGQVFPELEKDTADACAAFLTQCTGELAVATRYVDGVDTSTVWITTDDPGRAAEAAADLARILVRVEQAFGFDQRLLAFSEEESEAVGPYKTFRFLPDFPEEWAAYANKYLGGSDSLRAVADEGILRKAMLFAPAGGYLTAVSGKADEEMLGSALSATGGAREPLWDEAGVREAVSRIRFGQAGIGVADSDYAFRWLMLRVGGSGNGLIMANLLKRYHSLAQPLLRTSDEFFAWAVGSDGAHLTWELVSPAEAANAALYNLTFSGPGMEEIWKGALVTESEDGE